MPFALGEWGAQGIRKADFQSRQAARSQRKVRTRKARQDRSWQRLGWIELGGNIQER